MTTTTISFQELVPGSAGVRVTEDNLIWAVDLTVAVTGKNRDEAGMVLRRLSPDIFDSIKMIETNLPENHGKKTKLVTFDHALELVMVLPGKIAKEFRVKACDILKRYFAGDQSLHAELDRNAVSESPINQMARESLKRKYDEIEYEERKRILHEKQIELAERERMIPARVQAEMAAAKEREIAQQQKLAQFYRSLCPNGIMDDRATWMFKDRALNLLGAQLQIDNGADPDGSPTSVSDMIRIMGKPWGKEDAQKIGVLVAAKYRERYGDEAVPGKHPQFICGRDTSVNHYVARDHDLLKEVISTYVPGSSARGRPQRQLNAYFAKA